MLMTKQRVEVRRRPMRSLLAGVAVCAGLLVSSPWAMAQQAPAVLDAVPANAEIVVVVPSLSGLNQKLAGLNAALGNNVPWMNDTLGELKRNTGMLNGVNDSGSVAVVMSGLIESIDNDADEPPFVLLVPVSDYNAFIGNFNTQPAADGLTPVELQQGQSAFVRQVQGYAVLGADRDVVKNYTAGSAGQALFNKTGKLGGNAAGKSDVLLLVDLNQLGPKLLPKVNQSLDEAIAMYESNPELAGDTPVDVRVVLGLYKRVLGSLLQGTDMAVMGLDVTELGVGLSYAAQFKQGSEIASFIKPTTGSAAAILSLSADSPYFFASSQNYGSVDMPRILGLIKDTTRQVAPKFAGFVDLSVAMMEGAQGATAVYYPGQMGLGGGLFNGVTVIKATDGAAYMNGYRSFLDKLKQTRVPLDVPGQLQEGQAPAEMAFFTQYNANTTTVEGVAIDQYELRYDFPPAMMQEMGQMGQLMMMAGLSAQRGYVANVDNHVIITSTTDLPTLTQAIKTVREGKGLGQNQGITQVRQQLTPNPQFESYLNVGTLASFGLNMAAMFGQQLDVKVPANMAPVGYAISLGDNGASARVFVPMDVIKFTKDLTVMFAPMIMGGMGEGGAGNPEMYDAPAGPPR